MIKKILRTVFRIIPYAFFVKILNRERKRKTKLYGLLEGIYIERFYTDSPVVKNFDSTVKKAKSKSRYCLIQKLAYDDYSFVNACFVCEIMTLIVWCLENKYIPVFDVIINHGSVNNQNIWEGMFIQPYGLNVEYIKKNKKYIIFPFESNPWLSMQDTRNPKRVLIWSKIFNEFFVFNNFCREYLDKEYKEMIQGKKVLGCLIRGTGYSRIKPTGHPIQPDINEFIKKIIQIKKLNNLDYIYIATEESRYISQIKKVLGDIVVENKRIYFDDVYWSTNSKDFTDVLEIMHIDEFAHSLQYISSLNLVSQCDSLVAGLCGGSELAVFMNGNKYRSCYIFDKGVY